MDKNIVSQVFSNMEQCLNLFFDDRDMHENRQHPVHKLCTYMTRLLGKSEPFIEIKRGSIVLSNVYDEIADFETTAEVIMSIDNAVDKYMELSGLDDESKLIACKFRLLADKLEDINNY